MTHPQKSSGTVIFDILHYLVPAGSQSVCNSLCCLRSGCGKEAVLPGVDNGAWFSKAHLQQ